MPGVMTFAEIEQEFHQRVCTVVWCNCATIDAAGRPRSRVLHPLWEGATGWVTTKRSTPKIKQIAANPFCSLAYIQDPFKPVYVECRAVLDDDLTTRQRIWELCRNTPEPVGFDPAAIWGEIEDPGNVLLRLSPWRIELNDFSGPPRTIIWRSALR
jgi:general stress protein 26